MKLSWSQNEVFWTVLQITCFLTLLGLYLIVFRDIFRSHDIGGAAKMIWVVFVLFLPLLGVLLYLITRGGKMTQHNIDVAVAEAVCLCSEGDTNKGLLSLALNADRRDDVGAERVFNQTF